VIPATSTLLALDPALPMRDELLTPTAAGVEVVRCKYRVGESLRVLYRADDRLATVRVQAGGRPRWWLFPDDRRLTLVADVMAPSRRVRALLGGRPWVRSEVAEYAPERSLTVRALDATGTVSAYVKCYAPGTRDVAALAARHAAVAMRVAAPRPLGWHSDLLAMSPVAGRRCADVAPAEEVAVAERLGAAIATLHDVEPPAGTPPFGRLTAGRLDGAVAAVAAARPDVAAAIVTLRRRLGAARPGVAPVLLHGDCHPKNALVEDGRVSLIDLDQAGTGPAAADVGSYLARLRVAAVLERRSPGDADRLAAAFLAGYDAVRPRPPEPSLRWHTAAALVGEQAIRAVNRVRPDVLAHLPSVVAAAAEELG
jgi:aminoglycoside phosphotransferase (APT) family kinase protein